MDELSPLFQEIEFHERFRGYDPDEVDAYVDRVAKAAALVQGRLGALQERLEATEDRLAAGGMSESEETLTRTLVLAQRTADAAISEAREEAERVTAEASSEAEATLAAARAEAEATVEAAEERRQRLVEEAEAVAAEAASAERDRLASEVVDLQQFRAFLADDIEILERHLDEQRNQLALSVSALSELLESPEAFRLGHVPSTSGLHIDADLLAPPAPAEVSEADAGPSDESHELESQDEEPQHEESGEVDADDVVIDLDELGEPDEPAGVDDFAAPDDEVEAGRSAQEEDEVDLDEVVALHEPADAEETVIDLDAPGLDEQMPPTQPVGAHIAAEAPAEPEVTPMAESTPPRFVTAADVEAPPDMIDLEAPPDMIDLDAEGGGPPTAPIPMIDDGTLFAAADPAEDPFLSQLRHAVANDEVLPDDDEALSAFFDQEDDEGSRNWFGRRR